MHSISTMFITKYLCIAAGVYVATVVYTYLTMSISTHLALTYLKLSSQSTLMNRLNDMLYSLFTITASDNTRAVQVWTKASHTPSGIFGTVFTIVTTPFQYISQSSLAGWIYNYTYNISSVSNSNIVGFMQTTKPISLFERIATFFSSQNFTLFVPVAKVTSTQLSIHIPHWSEQLTTSVCISVGIYTVSYILSHTLHAVSNLLL